MRVYGDKMIIGASGHRYVSYEPILYKMVYEKFSFMMKDLKPEKVITGAALGFDTIVAEVCIELNIPFVAAVPFVGQENKWSDSQKEKYNTLLSKAAEIKIVSEGPFSKQKFQIRNQWIVDNSDEMIVYFTGQPGGTKNCIDYAKSVNKSISYILI